MKTTLLAAALAGCVSALWAQEPAQPPAVLQIGREVIKQGKGAAHRKTEQEYVNAYRKAKFPYYYLGLTAESGPSEVWFASGFPSFAAMEESDKLSDKAPLKAEIAMADLHEQFGDIDIYLFDQLLRRRITPGMRVLDAGCGSGRNLVYLLSEGYEVYGADADPGAIDSVRRLAASLAPALPAGNFRIEAIEAMSFPDALADVVLSSAVLHFARDEDRVKFAVCHLAMHGRRSMIGCARGDRCHSAIDRTQLCCPTRSAP